MEAVTKGSGYVMLTNSPHRLLVPHENVTQPRSPIPPANSYNEVNAKSQRA
jgi:hypothetical protein